MIDQMIEEAIEVEQDILSGIDRDASLELKPEEVFKRLQKFMNDQRERPPLQLRAATLFLSCYEIPDKTFADLMKRLGGKESQYGQALQMVRNVIDSKSPKASVRPKKVTRTRPVLDEAGKKEFRAKAYESQQKYGVLRSPPAIIDIIKKALARNLSANFHEVGAEASGAIEESNQGRLIVFILGGLSINELTAVQQFQKEIGKADIVIGGTELIGADDFISQLAHYNDPSVSKANKITNSLSSARQAASQDEQNDEDIDVDNRV